MVGVPVVDEIHLIHAAERVGRRHEEIRGAADDHDPGHPKRERVQDEADVGPVAGDLHTVI